MTQESLAEAFKTLTEIADQYEMSSKAFATLTEARRLILVEANGHGFDRSIVDGTNDA